MRQHASSCTPDQAKQCAFPSSKQQLPPILTGEVDIIMQLVGPRSHRLVGGLLAQHCRRHTLHQRRAWRSRQLCGCAGRAGIAGLLQQLHHHGGHCLAVGLRQMGRTHSTKMVDGHACPRAQHRDQQHTSPCYICKSRQACDFDERKQGRTPTTPKLLMPHLEEREVRVFGAAAQALLPGHVFQLVVERLGGVLPAKREPA